MRRIVLALCVGVTAALAAATGHAAVQTATNGILTIEIEDAGGDIGQWTVVTGASHPVPNDDVIFPIGTSYVTLRDVTASVMYANAGGTLSSGLGGFTFQSLQGAPCTAAVAAIAGGFQTTYTCPNWTVMQVVVLQGTTLADTAIRHSTTVTNTSAVSRQYGVRYMWDWYISGTDASIFRQRNPDTPFTSTFQGFPSPGFQAYEEVDNATTPTFSVFGTVQGGPLVPAPTAPDVLGYVSWGTSYSNPWDFAITGAGADSSVVYYWGLSAPLTIAAGASVTYTQYLTTQQSAIGVGPSVAVSIPTLADWAVVALAALVAGAALVSLRRRSSH